MTQVAASKEDTRAVMRRKEQKIVDARAEAAAEEARQKELHAQPINISDLGLKKVKKKFDQSVDVVHVSPPLARAPTPSTRRSAECTLN